VFKGALGLDPSIEKDALYSLIDPGRGFTNEDRSSNEHRGQDPRAPTPCNAGRNGTIDSYDFSLQFSCYVLGDRLQAPGLTKHIKHELLNKGGKRATDLTAEQVMFAYNWTAIDQDPLRAFCIDALCDEIGTEHNGRPKNSPAFSRGKCGS
jgi:hypothetical protein